MEKGRGNHTRRFDVPLELEKLTFDAHPIELLPEQNLNLVPAKRAWGKLTISICYDCRDRPALSVTAVTAFCDC